MWREAKDAPEEDQFGLQGSYDVRPLAKPVAFSFEFEVGNQAAGGARRLDDGAALLRRHRSVVTALEGDERRAAARHVSSRAACPVDLAAGRKWSDQAVEVARLELVGVCGQRLEVGDAKVVDAGGKPMGEGQRRQHRESACATATDDHAPAVHSAGAGQEV